MFGGGEGEGPFIRHALLRSSNLPRHCLHPVIYPSSPLLLLLNSRKKGMYANNPASSSSSVFILPTHPSPHLGPAHTHRPHHNHTMDFNTNTKPTPAPAVRSPASFYGTANAYAGAGYDAYAYGAQYPQYAAARLGASGAPSNECYLRQQRTIEIIALEEVPAPLPRRRRRQQQQQQQRLRPTELKQSVPASSSAASSSTCTSSSGDADDDDDDEDEEGGESYCSSEEDTDPRLLDPRERARVEVSFNARMRRIEQWRETYAKAVGAQLGPFPSLILANIMLTVRTAPSPSRTNSKRKGGSGSGDDTDADADMDNVRIPRTPAPAPTN